MYFSDQVIIDQSVSRFKFMDSQPRLFENKTSVFLPRARNLSQETGSSYIEVSPCIYASGFSLKPRFLSHTQMPKWFSEAKDPVFCVGPTHNARPTPQETRRSGDWSSTLPWWWSKLLAALTVWKYTPIRSASIQACGFVRITPVVGPLPTWRVSYS